VYEATGEEIEMRPIHLIGWLLATGLFAGTVSATEYDDPTWPCVQRKVEHLSLGLMWPFIIEPLPETAGDAVQGDIDALANLLSLRRVAVEDVEDEVRDFAETHDGDPAYLGQVFAEVFDALDTRRSRIIRGIGEFSLGQIALAERIDAARIDMDTLMAADEPDFDRVDELEEQIDWDQVIYSDRQRSIAYLCETPQLLERRLFAIAQMLQRHIVTE
jgi:hypothetical protein